MTSNTPIAFTVWMALVLRRAIAGSLGVCLAHVRTLLRVAAIPRAAEMVDPRVLVDPNDG
jgi:hypothetical protein